MILGCIWYGGFQDDRKTHNWTPSPIDLLHRCHGLLSIALNARPTRLITIVIESYILSCQQVMVATYFQSRTCSQVHCLSEMSTGVWNQTEALKKLTSFRLKLKATWVPPGEILSFSIRGHYESLNDGPGLAHR